MKRWLAIGTLLLGGGVAWATPTPSKTAIDLPAGAKLVGTAQVDEVRAFPEMNKVKNNNKGETTRTEDIVNAGALDRIFETSRPYKDAVSYFDGKVKDGDATQRSRTVTKTTTGWELQLPDGTMQNIVVRNTRPTTIETIQAVGSLEQDTFTTHESDNAPSVKPNAKSNDSNNNGNSNINSNNSKTNDNKTR